MAAPRYDLLKPYEAAPDAASVSISPFWVIAVVRLGEPVSFNRETRGSTTTTASDGVKPRGPTLVIDTDCTSLQLDRSKRNVTKNMTATLKAGGANYLREILPGDHILAWMVGSEADYLSLAKRIKEGKPCNGPLDGFRFWGRAHSIRHVVRVNPDTGVQNVDYHLQAVGFEELTSQIFYDRAIATVDLLQRRVGGWLARIGVDVEEFFKEKDPLKDNINLINAKLLDIFLGKGLSKAINPGAKLGLRASAGGGTDEGAPNAYVVPIEVGKLMGNTGGSKGVVAYADLLELLQGIQEYADGADDIKKFVPKLSKDATPARRLTTKPLTGSFLPYFADMINVPFWSVLQKFSNNAINEMYSCMRVNVDGKVVPTIVFRQIPFTTNAFNPELDEPPQKTDGPGEVAGESGTFQKAPAGPIKIHHTKFLDLPRWVLPEVLVAQFDIGRSNATRTNLVHVYGTALNQANNMTITRQLVQNPPIRDDLDIQRSGVHALMTTVDVAVGDTKGRSASKWMALISDWSIGSHLTLNGTIECYGIQAPVSEGDNVELNGIVYHIEAITDTCSIDFEGRKRWRTVLHVSNGVEAKVDDKTKPSYVGLDKSDEIGAGYPAVSEVTRTKEVK